LPAEAVVKLSGTPAAAGPFVSLMMVDGQILPEQADTAFAAGRFAPVPVLHGTVKDEGGFFASINELFNGPLTEAQYNAKTTAEILREYPASAYASPSLATIAAQSDPWACRARYLDQVLAKTVPVYAYEFADRTAPWYFPPLSFPHGAAHTIDLQFLFPNWHGGPQGTPHKLSPAEARLSRQMITAWTNFLYTGNPNRTGNQPWPAFHATDETYLSQTTPHLSLLRGTEFADQHHCAFWDRVQTY
jgi:para-nitrobenzyl esterase